VKSTPLGLDFLGQKLLIQLQYLEAVPRDESGSSSPPSQLVLSEIDRGTTAIRGGGDGDDSEMSRRTRERRVRGEAAAPSTAGQRRRRGMDFLSLPELFRMERHAAAPSASGQPAQAIRRGETHDVDRTDAMTEHADCQIVVSREIEFALEI
jgi:hypothetical protein